MENAVATPARSLVEDTAARTTTLSRRRLPLKARSLLRYLGPAFVVSVAYIDPGNFATNISGGSIFNYSLLWVILASNLMAIFLQSMSARLGIATGYNFPQMCGRLFPRPVNWFLWIQAELAAMATDLAEFLGGTLGLHLLFHIPLLYAGLLTGALTFAIVYLEKYGQRVVEGIIGTLVAVICAAYTLELFLARPDWAAVGLHTFVPSLPNGQATLIAVGMLGATVMPHVIYLHSQLVQHRRGINPTDRQKRRHLKLEQLDIAIAMNIAFVVNAAMVVVAAAVFYRSGLAVQSLEEAHRSLAPLLGPLSSWAFGIALLASGLSSSAVGTMSGQTIMQGFLNLNIPINLRRLITMAPALIIITVGINPLKALILSQVTLSFALPFAIVPLLLITRRRHLMGELASSRLTDAIGWLIAGIIISMNVILLYLTFTGRV